MLKRKKYFIFLICISFLIFNNIKLVYAKENILIKNKTIFLNQDFYIKLNNEFYILRKNNDKNIYATDAIFKNYFEDEFSEIDFKMTFKSLKTFDGYFDENNFNIIKDYFFKGKTYNYIYLYSFIDETIYFINKFENKPFASIEIEFDKFNDFDEAFSSKFLGSIH